MKMAEIMEDFLYRVKWFVMHDIVTILMWAGKFVIGGLVIACWDVKQFFEKRKKKGGVG